MNRLRRVPVPFVVGLTLLAAACGGGGGGSTPPVQTDKALVWGSGTWGAQRWSATLPVTLAADDTTSSSPSPSATTSSTDDLARSETRR